MVRRLVRLRYRLTEMGISWLFVDDVPGSVCDSAGLLPPEASPRRCWWWGAGAADEEAPVGGASQGALAEYESVGVSRVGRRKVSS